MITNQNYVLCHFRSASEEEYERPRSKHQLKRTSKWKTLPIRLRYTKTTAP